MLKKLQQNTLEQIIYALLILQFTITPLLIFTWTSELFEIPKMLFIYSTSITILFTWLLHLPIYGKLPFRTSKVDLIIILFLISQILATIFSIHPFTSIFGWYSRMNGGLASIICYLISFYAINTFLNREQITALIKSLIYASVPVSIYGILQHYGVDSQLWKQDVQHRIFASLGQPNWLAAYLTTIIPFTWLFILKPNHHKQNSNHYISLAANIFIMIIFAIGLSFIHRVIDTQSVLYINLVGLLIIFSFTLNLFKNYLDKSIQYYLIFIISFLALLFTKSRSGLIAFIVSDFIFWGALLILSLKLKNDLLINFKTVFKKFAIINLIVVVASLIYSTPYTPSVNDLIYQSSLVPDQETGLAISGGSPSSQIRQIVWQGAWQLGLQYPLFGTGVETFGYSYYWTRPFAHNLVSEWDFLYNKAHNEFLNYIATTGFIGFSTYLALIISIIYVLIKGSHLIKIINVSSIPSTEKQSNSTNILNLSVLCAFGSILITNYFGFSVVIISLFFYTIPAFSDQIKNQLRMISFPLKNLIFSFITLLITITGTIFLQFQVYQIFKADLEYETADNLMKNDDQQTALTLITQAIQRQPRQALYYDLASEISANLSIISFFSQQPDLAEKYANLSLGYSNRSLELSPFHLNIWKNRAAILINLTTIDPQLMQTATKSLEIAHELAPTDPKVTYNLALLYSRQDMVHSAIETLYRTTEMKPNYPEPYYALALLHYQQATSDSNSEIQDQNELNAALQNLHTYLNFVPEDPKALEKLNQWTTN